MAEQLVSKVKMLRKMMKIPSSGEALVSGADIVTTFDNLK